uniref:Uncharacterized protein n=1 Tax=viral metagenome TaxID=1070528 RepID=A0A6C0EG17_9ZZZZ
MAEKYLEMDDRDFYKLTNTFLDKHTLKEKDLKQKEEEEEFIQRVLKTEKIQETLTHNEQAEQLVSSLKKEMKETNCKDETLNEDKMIEIVKQ